MINDETMERLRILTDVAKFDVSCASSGVSRSGGGGGTMGNSLACGICHSFADDGRCISLLKLLQSNECVFDCKYCLNRRSNDIQRTSLTSEEVAEITMEFYKRNYIEGLFLSSAVKRSPDDTMAELVETVRLLRQKYGFYGYIHCKTIPGASPELIETAGRLADRISVNIELPSEKSLNALAPQKKKNDIINPMKYIAGRIDEDRQGGGRRLLSGGSTGGLTIYSGSSADLYPYGRDLSSMPASYGKGSSRPRRFAPGGQSTQMIVGATDDTDMNIIRLSEAFYKKMELKRVYYSAYIPVNSDRSLPAPGTPPPLKREHRLYQADWLLRFYGFEARELLDESRPNFDEELDPKCDWALRHPEFFPVEVNKADYEMLLRVPGIGVLSAKRIVRARRISWLGFDELKRMGIVLKRAKYFITCKGRMFSGVDIDSSYVRLNLIGDGPSVALSGETRQKPEQLSLFDVVI